MRLPTPIPALTSNNPLQKTSRRAYLSSSPQTVVTSTLSSTAPTVDSISKTASAISTTTSVTLPEPRAISHIKAKATPAQKKVLFRRIIFNMVKPTPRIIVTTTETSTTSATVAEGSTTSQPAVTKMSFVQICKTTFCGRSAVTGRFARPCQSYEKPLMIKACNTCRSNDAALCNTRRGLLWVSEVQTINNFLALYHSNNTRSTKTKDAVNPPGWRGPIAEEKWTKIRPFPDSCYAKVDAYSDWNSNWEISQVADSARQT